MDEYICRGSLMKRFCERCNEEMSESPCEPSVRFAREVIKAIKSADVATVRHAQWEWDTEDIYRCSNCAEKSHVKEVMGHPEWAYCPNCGAKMDGGADNG